MATPLDFPTMSRSENHDLVNSAERDIAKSPLDIPRHRVPFDLASFTGRDMTAAPLDISRLHVPFDLASSTQRDMTAPATRHLAPQPSFRTQSAARSTYLRRADIALASLTPPRHHAPFDLASSTERDVTAPPLDICRHHFPFDFASFTGRDTTAAPLDIPRRHVPHGEPRPRQLRRKGNSGGATRHSSPPRPFGEARNTGSA
ncbi:hypothetical protein NONI108955_06930 [Nocardia ninae]